MSMFPPDHPLRTTLADEVHARPPESVQAPARASYVAVLVDPSDRDRELAHLQALCTAHGVEPPAAGATHFRCHLGDVRLKWERHGEFSGYTVMAPGIAQQPFESVASSLLTPGWMADIPGQTVASAHAKLLPSPDDAGLSALLEAAFARRPVAGSVIADGAARVYTDFLLHDGSTRFVLVDSGLTERQAGRTLQRLFEIEAYRMMALLALPIARRQSPRIVEIEAALASLTDGIARADSSGRSTGDGSSRGTVGSDGDTRMDGGDGGRRGSRSGSGTRGGSDGGSSFRTSHGAASTRDDEALLQELTRLAAEVESGLAASQFRFGACRAYFELVTRRIVELRETRLPGMQTIEEFMSRRLTPAMATCSTVSQRLHDLSERVAQASALLSTRVDIARERQNQALLASMDRRAKLQLRLQQTVEGLSVAAICYYAAGLVGYLAKALKAAGLRIEPDLAVGLTIPAVAVAVMVAVRRARRRVSAADPGH